MMNIYKVEGYGKFYEKSLFVLGKDFDEAERIVAEQFGLEVKEVGKCFTICFYTNI